MPNDLSRFVISKRGWEFIIAAEVPSEEIYKQQYQSPTWAGGDSGVIIGISYDLGYTSREEATETWALHLAPDALDKILDTCGIKGAACKELLPSLAGISIPYNVALNVFYTTTLPACARDVKRIYPGVENLPPDARAALLSLIFNRGPVINDSNRRKEMKALVRLVASADLKGMAAQVRSMKRLWNTEKQKSFIERREKEATLIEQANFELPPEDLVEI